MCGVETIEKHGIYGSETLNRNQVLDVDLTKTEDVTPETVRKARRMLTILAASTPQTPNVTALCRNLGMDRKAGLKVLYALRRAGLLGLLAEDADALKHLTEVGRGERIPLWLFGFLY